MPQLSVPPDLATNTRYALAYSRNSPATEAFLALAGADVPWRPARVRELVRWAERRRSAGGRRAARRRDAGRFPRCEAVHTHARGDVGAARWPPRMSPAARAVRGISRRVVCSGPLSRAARRST
jgi:hypothetical protein